MACERVVEPAGCIEAGCPRLYSYEREGHTWIGCLEGVYEVEIELEGLRRLQRTAAGFGGLRASREPLPICRSQVERTFEHRVVGQLHQPGLPALGRRRHLHGHRHPPRGRPPGLTGR